MFRKKFTDCEIETMQRRDGTWVCFIESPHNSYVSVGSVGFKTEQESIEVCKINWKNTYGKTNQKKITLHIPQTKTKK